jgi:acetyltransferase
MWRYTCNLRGLYETPSVGTDPLSQAGSEAARTMVSRVREAGRTILTEAESKDLLRGYGVPTVETQVAGTAEEAVRCAGAIGYPVVLKLLSQVLTHKSDVGGVKLNLLDADGVGRAFAEIREAAIKKAGAAAFSGVTVQPMVQGPGYELILGSYTDPQFGPVLLFGSGGVLVEVFRDRALALPPLNATLARRLMQQTRIFAALQGVRGQAAVDLLALEQVLVRFSQLVVEQRMIKEIDINPLVVSAGRIVALDARIILHEAAMTADRLPRLAIRPYPEQYAGPWTLRDGTQVTIRPVRPEDEPMVVHLHEGLSERSVRLRYFQALKLDQRTAHERLIRVCFIDYDREMALVTEHVDAASGERSILGIARLSRQRFSREAEFSLLISDSWQHHGLGTELLRRLLRIGEAEGLSRITADILSDNQDMQRVCKRLGFKLSYSLEDPVVKAEIDLPVAAPP